MIRKAKIVQEEDVKGDVVNVGLKVTVKDLDTGEKETFAIVPGMALLFSRYIYYNL